MIKYNTKGDENMNGYIKLTSEERMLVENYAKKHSLSLEEAFKQALFERIEDEYDRSIANEAHKEYVDSGKKSNTVTKLWDELNL